jgi:hypothetical protein
VSDEDEESQSMDDIQYQNNNSVADAQNNEEAKENHGNSQMTFQMNQ